MVVISSPLSEARLKVSTAMKPRTTEPLAAVGVKVTAMVPDWPGARLIGVYGAVASTLCAQTSPLLAEAPGSNGKVLATAARLTVEPGATPLGGNGPVGSGRPKKKPGATSGSVRVATEVLPDDMPSRSGSPFRAWMSMVTGTVPWAATVRLLVPVGTSQLGWADSGRGSGTSLTSEPRSCSGVRWLSRASAKKSFLTVPVLVTLMVAVTGCPAD